MITAKELMVGDFVYDTDTSTLLCISALHDLIATGTDAIKREYDVNYEDLIGLPLCDDILNIDTRWEDAFDPKCHNEPGMLIHENLGLFKFKDKYWLGLYYYDGVERLLELKYVHELQHVLVVFGSTMAADILNIDYVYTTTPIAFG